MAPERADAHILHHRETDPAGSDFRRRRYCEEREVVIKRNGGGTKVLIVIGSSAISILLALVAFFGVRDRVSVDRDIVRIDNQVQQLEAIVTGNTAQIQVLNATQIRFGTDVTEVKQNQERMMAQMNNLILEIRKIR